MIEQLKVLQQFLKANKMEQTLQSLRSQILGKYAQAPSHQFTSLFQQPIKKNVGKNIEFTNLNSSRKTKVQQKMKSELIVQGLLGKIAYSSKLLQDPILINKISNLAGNKIFQNSLNIMFPETKNQNNLMYIESSFEFKDELQLIQSDQSSQIIAKQNVISNIQMQPCEESSIVSQPSLVLEELNKIEDEDEYDHDNDLGYFEFLFNQNQLMAGCSKLTEKFGYPEKAIKKNTKTNMIFKKTSVNKKQSKFPQGVKFPNSNDTNYPRQYNGIIYDVLKLKVIFDREKTGCELQKQFQLHAGDILAGRYQIQAILGSGVFAKVLKVFDLVKKQWTCLKMVSNNKDFFDQALDQVKILRYISANCNPDEYNLLKFKGAFYHRQHFFIETDLMLDNLFTAYKKNPSFFSIQRLRQVSKQILQALTALHGLHIIHADLKPQNIMVKSYNPLKIKIVDLGNSGFFHDHLGEYVQSRSYRAPEVILGATYDSKIDIWSVGCIIAELWTKNVLFYNHHIQGMLARIQSIVGPWPEWLLDKGNAVQSYFSKENLIYFEEDGKFHILIPKMTTLKARIRSDDEKFLSFLEATLRIDPNLRVSAEEGLEHPFICGF